MAGALESAGSGKYKIDWGYQCKEAEMKCGWRLNGLSHPPPPSLDSHRHGEFCIDFALHHTFCIDFALLHAFCIDTRRLH
ncbi:unnamed protein product [Didymodactylos carnosus]|uniref:Uncharacterized protein n=1 Tax=Didymodactylos carnosus TaxID=1234261 RepID=A0A815XYR0_9BILA|nr:unnamed protein product [Didymodactylos carnosus]CAF4426211.1 unnamed protein product [Didymodactylos carnosus]